MTEPPPGNRKRTGLFDPASLESGRVGMGVFHAAEVPRGSVFLAFLGRLQAQWVVRGFRGGRQEASRSSRPVTSTPTSCPVESCLPGMVQDRTCRVSRCHRDRDLHRPTHGGGHEKCTSARLRPWRTALPADGFSGINRLLADGCDVVCEAPRGRCLLSGSQAVCCFGNCA